MNSEPGSERRRSLRAELKIPIVIRWNTQEGTREEHTETMVINANGCLVLAKGPASEGLDVDVANEISGEVRKGKVVYCGKMEPEGRTHVGIELYSPNPKFWGSEYVDFVLRMIARG